MQYMFSKAQVINIATECFKYPMHDLVNLLNRGFSLLIIDIRKRLNSDGLKPQEIEKSITHFAKLLNDKGLNDEEEKQRAIELEKKRVEVKKLKQRKSAITVSEHKKDLNTLKKTLSLFKDNDDSEAKEDIEKKLQEAKNKKIDNIEEEDEKEESAHDKYVPKPMID